MVLSVGGCTNGDDDGAPPPAPSTARTPAAFALPAGDGADFVELRVVSIANPAGQSLAITVEVGLDDGRREIGRVDVFPVDSTGPMTFKLAVPGDVRSRLADDKDEVAVVVAAHPSRIGESLDPRVAVVVERPRFLRR